ncbi:MAG: F0F1 ATP synthase subunit B [Saprospiraceae bacterium]|nr:F0F1 ATP synthase subunit B [Saprospiraceae bacterium]
MLFLADFSVIKPDFGLFFWSCLIFILFWVLIGKFAFKPIADALRKRENDIQSALDEAGKAREEMAKMQAENEALLNQAREERSQMLKDAKETKDAIIKEAKEGAKEEASKILTNASLEIENQKKNAIAEVKNQAGLMAISITERLVKEELKDKASQEQLVRKLVDEINLS